MGRIVGVIRQQAMQLRSLPRAMRGCRGMKRRMALTLLASIHKRFWLGESGYEPYLENFRKEGSGS